jgi:LPS-assembly protein
VAVAGAFVFSGPSPARADDVTAADGLVVFQPDVPVRIAADSLEYDQLRKLYVARGNVRITQEGRELQAEWIAFSNVTRRGVASGGVVFTDGVDTVYTEFIEFDVDTLEGVMFEAEFDRQRDQMELRGREVVKTGEQTYTFKDGEFTTCQCPDDDAREPWQIAATSADLEIEGYGETRNATFEVLGVPVAWVPWMLWPLKTERQTGLLFPHINVSGRRLQGRPGDRVRRG